jgi:hypothetical protein
MVALGRTWQLQPQLLENQPLTKSDIQLLQAFMQKSAQEKNI